MPTISDAIAIAVQHHQAGRLDAAEQIYRQILTIDPNQVDAIHLLGVIANQVGQPDVAVEYITRAIRLNRKEGTFYCNLGNALLAQGKLEDAIARFRRAVELRPTLVEAHNNLGDALKQLGMLDEAVASCHRALQLKPDFAEAHNNLANALRSQGKLAESVDSYHRALELRPDLVEARANLGDALLAQGKLDEAIACCRRALEFNPDFPLAHTNLGGALLAQGKPEEAVACYRQALQLKPDAAEGHSNLGNALRELRMLDEAATCCRRALQLKPDFAEAHINLGNVLKEQGRPDEAIACYRRALELRPRDASAYDNLLCALYWTDCDAAAICEEHRRWNERFAEPLKKFPSHANERSADRRLRVGYVSGDFCEHVVALFMLPLLEAHDHERFEIYCYASQPEADAITNRCRAQADAWRDVFDVSDEQLANIIHDDQIDVLVDLAMHSVNNRLLAFARKPAPVQVTYLAYAGTTGLATMDYRLTDPYLDPPGASEHIYCEESICLPQTWWCYRPLVETADANDLPALQSGRITFGCLNNFSKVTAPTLSTWTKLLQAMPEAQLLLHAHPGSHRDWVRDLFVQQDISPERLAFAGLLPMGEYFRLYHRIDVALDPFPYGGGTTTCDALWMGVPVVSLAGEKGPGRGGLSILSNVGLTDLVACDSEQYVHIAKELAHDRVRLSELRGTLRKRMQNSPLMDAARFARNVEGAYRAMWRRWCA